METAVNIYPVDGRPSYDVVVTTPGAALCEAEVRSIAKQQRAKVQSISKRGPQRAHLRMITSRVYDVVIALEAVGMEVVRVVAAPRATV